MGLVDYISRHPVGWAAIVSELDNTFLVVQIREINWLIALAAKEGSMSNDIMSETRTEQELRNRKIRSAKKPISAFKNCHLIRVIVNNHTRTEIAN